MRNLLIALLLSLLWCSNVVSADESPRITSVEVVDKVENTPPKDECFIATAAYGSKFQPSVVLLRQFRDQYLLTNSAGQAFVKFYYTNSPPIADFIAGNEFLKATVRLLLTPAVVLVYLLFHPVWLLLVALLAFVGVQQIIERKKSQLHIR